MHSPQANKEVIEDKFRQSQIIKEINPNNSIVVISWTLFNLNFFIILKKSAWIIPIEIPIIIDNKKIRSPNDNILNGSMNLKIFSSSSRSATELNKDIATALFNIDSPKLIAFNFGSLSSIKEDKFIIESVAQIPAENWKISDIEKSIWYIFLPEWPSFIGILIVKNFWAFKQ